MSDLPEQPLPADPPAPDELEPVSPISMDASPDLERRDRQQDLERSVVPAFDFFLFSLISGLALIPAVLFDSPGLYLLTALFAPFLGPLLGLALAVPTGSARMFGRSLLAVVLGAAFLFGAGAAAGLLAGQWPGLEFNQTAYHATFNWPDMLVLALGAVFAAYSLARSPRRRPLIASVALGYELYLPAGVAGFGLTSGQIGLWPDALVVFGVHLVLAVLLAILAFWSIGQRPRGLFGTTALLIFLALVIGAAYLLSGFAPAFRLPAWIPGTPTATLQPTRTLSPSVTVQLSTTSQSTRQEPAAGLPTATGTPQPPPTETATPRPTQALAIVAVRNGDGIFIRLEPSSSSRILTSLLNGNRIWVLSDPIESDGNTWVPVRTEGGEEGWVVASLLATPTPVP